MYFRMYNGKIPFEGYIVEELLLDNNKIPSDYKCYLLEENYILLLLLMIEKNK